MTPGILLDWIKTFPKFGTDQGLRPISVKLRNGGLTTRGDQRGDNLIFLVTFDALFTSYIILSSSWLIVCAGLFFLLFSPEKVSGLSNQGRARLSINIFLPRCLKMGDRLNWTSVWAGRMFRVYMRGRHDYGGDAAKKKKKGGLQAQQEGGGQDERCRPKLDWVLSKSEAAALAECSKGYILLLKQPACSLYFAFWEAREKCMIKRSKDYLMKKQNFLQCFKGNWIWFVKLGSKGGKKCFLGKCNTTEGKSVLIFWSRF